MTVYSVVCGKKANEPGFIFGDYASIDFQDQKYNQVDDGKGFNRENTPNMEF